MKAVAAAASNSAASLAPSVAVPAIHKAAGPARAPNVPVAAPLPPAKAGAAPPRSAVVAAVSKALHLVPKASIPAPAPTTFVAPAAPLAKAAAASGSVVSAASSSSSSTGWQESFADLRRHYYSRKEDWGEERQRLQRRFLFSFLNDLP